MKKNSQDFHGIVLYSALFVLSMVAFLFFPENLRVIGIVLLVWGAYTLRILTTVTKKGGKEKKDKNSLPDSIISELNHSIFAGYQKSLIPLTGNLILLLFVPGIVYMVAEFYLCKSLPEDLFCFHDLQRVMSLYVISGLSFWTVQIRTVSVEKAAVFQAVITGVTVSVFIGLLLTGHVIKADSVSFLRESFAWHSDMILYAAGLLCLMVYLNTLFRHDCRHELIFVSIAMCVLLAVIELFYVGDATVSAVQFGCWAVMGIGWAHSRVL